MVRWGGRDWERCTYRGQTKGNLYNDRDDGKLQHSRWESKNPRRAVYVGVGGGWKGDVIRVVSSGA